MIEYLIGSLLLAWFLSFLGIDVLFVQGANELFRLNLSIASFYLLFFLGGLVIGLTDTYRKKS
ncbi:hypothetical protein D3C73_510030 [compost metagenome]